MSANIEPEEAHAISELFDGRDASRRASEVSQRDFRLPHRFAPERREALLHRLEASLPQIRRAMRDVFGRGCRVDVADLHETAAQGLFADLDPPFALGRFTVGGQPGWIVWQIEAAVASVEHILGSGELTEGPRELTVLERDLVRRIFTGAVNGAAKALELDVKELRVIVDPVQIGTWRDGGPDADQHRLVAGFAIDSPGGPSTLHLYLPTNGLRAGEEVEDHAPIPADLPDHLRPVEVELGAWLGASDVPLAQLLELEVGDVIPLETPVGSPVQLEVEGEICARATVGVAGGRLAVRVLPPEQSPSR